MESEKGASMISMSIASRTPPAVLRPTVKVGMTDVWNSAMVMPTPPSTMYRMRPSFASASTAKAGMRDSDTLRPSMHMANPRSTRKTPMTEIVPVMIRGPYTYSLVME